MTLKFWNFGFKLIFNYTFKKKYKFFFGKRSISYFLPGKWKLFSIILAVFAPWKSMDQKLLWLILKSLRVSKKNWISRFAYLFIVFENLVKLEFNLILIRNFDSKLPIYCDLIRKLSGKWKFWLIISVLFHGSRSKVVVFVSMNIETS